jgi:hypothetical protein
MQLLIQVETGDIITPGDPETVYSDEWMQRMTGCTATS